MKWRNKSLRRRLALWLILPLGAISALMLLEVRSSAEKAANLAYDRVLLGSALAIAERVVIESNEILVDVPYVALEMLTSAAQDRVFYQVLGPDDTFITGYSDLPEVPAELKALPNRPLFFDDSYKGMKIRVGVVYRFVSSPRLSGRVTIKVAETVESRTALINEMFSSAALRQAVLIIVASLILWIGLGWGLRPLSNLEQALHRRSPKDLRPILHEVPYEVSNLVGAINQLMLRLGASMTAMQRFTANAAHQLRTPLAAIQAQTEVALGETDPKEINKTLGHLRDATSQTSRMVTQLLSLARATPDTGETVFELFDLCDVCTQVTQNMVPRAIEKDIDLGLEIRAQPLHARGDPTLFEELLRNLIHNAISYCPAHSLVTVRLDRAGSQNLLEVIDDGPGIREEDREHVFERFYRGSGAADSDGCGLGLPIVREIARCYGGDVSIVTGAQDKGTCVQVRIPTST